MDALQIRIVPIATPYITRKTPECNVPQSKTDSGLSMKFAITPHMSLPPLKVTLIMLQMILAIQPLVLGRQLSHPISHLCAFRLQLLRYSVDVDRQVVPQKLTNVGVLMISDERLGGVWVGGVDIYVGGCDELLALS